MTTLVVIAAVLVTALVVLIGVLVRQFVGTPRLEGVSIDTPEDDTKMGPDGACRSVQTATVTFRSGALPALWTEETLERLGRTYWAFMTRFTLGLVRVFYTPTHRSMSLLIRPARLLTFDPPEYESTPDGGKISWQIVGGLLLSKSGREHGAGHLDIEVRRLEPPREGFERVRIEVEIENFYPTFQRISPWLYRNTQSRIHVLLAYGFLRRIVKRDLEQSVTGRFTRH